MSEKAKITIVDPNDKSFNTSNTIEMTLEDGVFEPKRRELSSEERENNAKKKLPFKCAKMACKGLWGSCTFLPTVYGIMDVAVFKAPIQSALTSVSAVFGAMLVAESIIAASAGYVIGAVQSKKIFENAKKPKQTLYQNPFHDLEFCAKTAKTAAKVLGTLFVGIPACFIARSIEQKINNQKTEFKQDAEKISLIKQVEPKKYPVNTYVIR